MASWPLTSSLCLSPASRLGGCRRSGPARVLQGCSLRFQQSPLSEGAYVGPGEGLGAESLASAGRQWWAPPGPLDAPQSRERIPLCGGARAGRAGPQEASAGQTQLPWGARALGLPLGGLRARTGLPGSSQWGALSSGLAGSGGSPRHTAQQPPPGGQTPGKRCGHGAQREGRLPLPSHPGHRERSRTFTEVGKSV